MGASYRAAATLILVALVAAALVNGFYLPLAGRRVRPEHIMAPLACGAFFAFRLLRRESPWRLDAFSFLAVAWVLVNGISSWLYAPHPRESLVHVLRLAFLAATFLTVANLPPVQSEDWCKRLRLWLVMGLAALGYGLFTWTLARYAEVWLPGVYVEPALSGISVKGSQFERNLFGILAATLLAVAFYLLSADRRSRPFQASTGFLVVACAVAGGATVLSLTRSAWLALIAAGPVAYVLFDRRGLSRADQPLLRAMVGLPILLGVLIATLRVLPAPAVVRSEPALADVAGQTAPPASPSGTTAAVPNPAPPSSAAPVSGEKQQAAIAPATSVEERLSTFSRLRSDVTVSTRVQDARWALEDWMASPLLGRGTGSFAQIHGMRAGSEAWVSNLFLHTLVDTGLVGLAIQVALFILVARRTWLAARVTTEREIAVGLKAMTLGFLVMAIAYQLTDGTWLAVFWVHLGLMVSGAYGVRDEQQRRAEDGSSQLDIGRQPKTRS